MCSVQFFPIKPFLKHSGYVCSTSATPPFQSLFLTYVLRECTVLLYFHRKHTMFIISTFSPKFELTTWSLSTNTFGLTETSEGSFEHLFTNYHAPQNTSVPITNSGPTDETKIYHHTFLKARQSMSSPTQTLSLYLTFI